MASATQLGFRATFVLIGFLFFPLIASENTARTAPDVSIQLSHDHAGLSATQGKRAHMEDYYQAGQTPQCEFYAVYDGHCGHQVAEYAAANLHNHILEHQEFDTNINKAIKESFEGFHTELTKLGNDDQGNPIANQQGTTAVIALIKKDTLHLAWAGDSRGVVVQKNGCIATKDHKPWEYQEFSRIFRSGGKFNDGYIYDSKKPNYGLACSRSLGDMILNNVGVIPTPEIQTLQLSPNQQFLILASDGIWDVCSSEHASAIIKTAISNGKTCAEAADDLVAYATKKQSTDNMTVLVVDLRKMSQDTNEQQNKQNSFLKHSLKHVAAYGFASLLLAYNAVKGLIG